MIGAGASCRSVGIGHKWPPPSSNALRPDPLLVHENATILIAGGPDGSSLLIAWLTSGPYALEEGLLTQPGPDRRRCAARLR